jgi:hypothetical protein
MKKYIVFLAIVLLGTTFIIKAQGEVSFFEEHIDFSIDDNYFCINGIYSFQNRNHQDINQQIIFPFADESTEIDSIRIINLHSGRKIDFNKKGNFIRFSVYLPANDTVDVNIFYRQKTSVKNKYIITSTQFWGKPLEKAVYTLTAEQNIKIKSFSYLPNSIKEANDRKLYIWEKSNFMPKDDFEVILDD